MSKKLFKNTVVDLGEIKGGSKGVEVFWEFEDLSKNDIAYNDDGSPAIKPGCGCTASFEVGEDGIYAKYNDSGNKTGKITKALTVYRKDGDSPVKVLSARGGGSVYNSNLPKVTLKFTAIII